MNKGKKIKTTKDLMKIYGKERPQDLDEREILNQKIKVKTERKLADKRISEYNRKWLYRYSQELKSRKVSVRTWEGAIYWTHKFAVYLKSKKFDKVTKYDVNDYCDKAESVKQFSESTNFTRRLQVKSFFRWFYNEKSIDYEGDWPPPVKHLHLRRVIKTRHMNDLLSPKEVKSMINACDNIRNKAVLITLYESGARAGELLSLKVKDVIIEKHSIDINIRHSKTIPRTVTLVDSYPYLVKYLNEHPGKNNPEDPLFINLSKGHFGRALLHQGLISIVQTSAKRAGIKKYCHPHLFRHSRATHNAGEGWNEAQLREWFGWTKKSSTPSIYVHLGSQDIKKKVLSSYGLLDEYDSKEELENSEALKTKVCSRCGKKNPADAIACNCGMALSISDVKKMKKLELESKEFMDDIESMSIDKELIRNSDNMQDYVENLVQNNPVLKKQFMKIAREVINSGFYDNSNNDMPITKSPIVDKYREQIIELSNRGWNNLEIAKFLKINPKTVKKAL